MNINITLNGVQRSVDILARETLFHLLRRQGIHSVKFGSEDGSAGYSAVLVNGNLRNSIVMLAAQADGTDILTVEGLSGHHRPGLASTGHTWHPLQKAFIEMSAIQSGYDTPALILAGKSLLDRNPSPTEAEVRDAISGIISRETGYTKPVHAILRAAAYLRGEDPGAIEGGPGNEMFLMPEGLVAFTIRSRTSGKWRGVKCSNAY